jgi:very-short-patch-repair endonuclease
MNYADNLNYGAKEIIISNAKNLRKHLTHAEKLLWENLRDRKLVSFKFRRQHPIDIFVADFYCHEKKLVIEVDGGIHLEQDQMEYDANRTKALNELGIKVVRFNNEEVLNSIHSVLQKIKTICESR